jgi:hypothetical protein
MSRADAISAEGGSLLKRNPTRRGLTTSPRECKGLNGGRAEPDRPHPPSSGRKVQEHELCVRIVVTRNRPTRVDRPETTVNGPTVGGIQQPPLLPTPAPANSRGTDPYRQTAPGNEVTTTALSWPGSSPSDVRPVVEGWPKKRRPRGKPGDKDDADVGAVCCEIEGTSTSAANATR